MCAFSREESVALREVNCPSFICALLQGDSQVNNDMKQISNALRYFQDSVEKNTLGHLPGSASIVLEYVLHLISLLKKDLINDQR